MKITITKPIELSEDFIQALQSNQIEPQRAEIRIYPGKRIAIEIYIECVGFGFIDFDLLDRWGLHGAIICGVGYHSLSIYHGYVTSDVINKITKEGGEECTYII